MTFSNAQWATALDLDFTAQPSQTLNLDTNYTIGTSPYTGTGLVWTKFNSTGDSTAMALTNGTGLVITPSAATNISGSTLTAPLLRIPLISIIPDWTVFMPFRIWIWESASTEAANFDQIYFGTFIPNGGFPNQFTLGHYRGFQGGTNGWGAQLTVLQSNVVQTSTAIPLSANRVGVMAYPNGVIGGICPLVVGSTVTSQSTTLAAASGGQTLPQATISVASVVGFSNSGNINVTTAAGVQLVTYTGINFAANQFTGCTGGSGLMSTGGAVAQGTWPSLGSLTYTTAAAITASSSAAISSTGSGAQTVPTVNFFISALRAGSGTAYSATIARFRVDYIPLNN